MLFSTLVVETGLNDNRKQLMLVSIAVFGKRNPINQIIAVIKLHLAGVYDLSLATPKQITILN